MKRGFTLIELLVYMAIMGFIIVVAGRAFSDSTSMRVRSQNMLKSSEEAGRVSAILKEDISQAGTKAWMKSPNSNTDIFDYDKDVLMIDKNQDDYSSYNLIKNENENEDFDQLSFRKVHYGQDGVRAAVVEIIWKVENGVLKRSCEIISGSAQELENECSSGESPFEIEVAENITKFKFLPSKPGPKPEPGVSGNPSSPSAPTANEIIFPASGETFSFAVNNINGSAYANQTDNKVIITGFPLNTTDLSTNAVEAYLANGSVNDACQEFNFKAGEEYAIDFDLPYEADNNDAKKVNRIIMFQPGRDHLSIGLRKEFPSIGTLGMPVEGVPDFLFYPPQTPNELDDKSKSRHFVFSVQKDVSACIAITAAFYGQVARQGFLTFENFRVSRKLDRIFHFDREDPSYNPTATGNQKASVKAFELTLGVEKGKEDVQNVTVIPVLNNGIVPTGGAVI